MVEQIRWMFTVEQTIIQTNARRMKCKEKETRQLHPNTRYKMNGRAVSYTLATEANSPAAQNKVCHPPLPYHG